MQETDKRANGLGSAVRLKGKRNKPYAARITIGRDIDGRAIKVDIDTFTTKLNCLVFLENYHKEPYSIYIEEEKYNRIITFPKKPYPLVPVQNPRKRIVEKSKKDNYTFKQVYDGFCERYMPTLEEQQLEKNLHIKPVGKLAYHASQSYITAYNKCEELYYIVYKDLKKADFQLVVNKYSKTCDSSKRLILLFKKLDDYAMEENIIDKPQSQFLRNTGHYTPTRKKTPFTYEEIQELWDMQPQDKYEEFIRDFYLIALYTGARAEELLFIYTKNIFLDEDYFIAGLKSDAGINRIIPIHKSIKHLFVKYYNQDKEFLLTNSNGTRMKYPSYNNIIQEIKKNYTFLEKHTAHECRHTLRSELERIGIKKVIINKIIGHKSNDVGDDIYTYKWVEELSAAINMVTYKKSKNLYIFTNSNAKKTS